MFTYLISNTSLVNRSVLSAFWRREHWGIEKLNYLFNIIESLRAELGFESQLQFFQSLGSYSLYYTVCPGIIFIAAAVVQCQGRAMRTEVVSQGQGELCEKAEPESAGPENQSKAWPPGCSTNPQGRKDGQTVRIESKVQGLNGGVGLIRFSEESHAGWHERDPATGVEKLLKRTCRSGMGIQWEFIFWTRLWCKPKKRNW